MDDDFGVSRNSNGFGRTNKGKTSAGSPAKRKPSTVKPIYVNTNNGNKYEEPKTYLDKTLKLWEKVWNNVLDIPSQQAFYELYIGRFPQYIKITSYPINKDTLLVMYSQMVQSRYEM